MKKSQIKDYADILALLDYEYGGTNIDIAFLGEQFSQTKKINKAEMQRWG